MNKRLIEHLHKNGFVDQATLRSVLVRQKQTGGRLEELLLRLRVLSETDLVRAYSSFYRYPAVDLNGERPGESALGVVERDFALEHQLLPLSVDKDTRVIRVAIWDPARSLDALESIRRRTGVEPQPMVAQRTALLQAIDYYYFGKVPNRRDGQPSGSGITGDYSIGITQDVPRVDAGNSGLFAEAPEGGRTRRFGRGPDQGSSDAWTTPTGASRSGEGRALARAEARGDEALEKRVAQLEEALETERRKVNVLTRILIESGLTTREEIIDRAGQG